MNITMCGLSLAIVAVIRCGIIISCLIIQVVAKKKGVSKSTKSVGTILFDMLDFDKSGKVGISFCGQ